ncbi:hypothetical protein E4U12_000152 [Claviceps purpurea]|nr:hypothetical protein E4U12_000152 [Claviceps purpurea]
MSERPSPELIEEAQRIHRLLSATQQKVKLSPQSKNLVQHIAFDFDDYQPTEAQAFDYPIEWASLGRQFQTAWKHWEREAIKFDQPSAARFVRTSVPPISPDQSSKQQQTRTRADSNDNADTLAERLARMQLRSSREDTSSSPSQATTESIDSDTREAPKILPLRAPVWKFNPLPREEQRPLFGPPGGSLVAPRPPVTQRKSTEESGESRKPQPATTSLVKEQPATTSVLKGKQKQNVLLTPSPLTILGPDNVRTSTESETPALEGHRAELKRPRAHSPMPPEASAAGRARGGESETPQPPRDSEDTSRTSEEAQQRMRSEQHSQGPPWFPPPHWYHQQLQHWGPPPNGPYAPWFPQPSQHLPQPTPNQPDMMSLMMSVITEQQESRKAEQEERRVEREAQRRMMEQHQETQKMLMDMLKQPNAASANHASTNPAGSSVPSNPSRQPVRTTDIGFFEPEIADTKGQGVVTDAKASGVIYKCVFAFTQRLQDMAKTRTEEAIKEVWISCLRGSALEWHSMLLTPAERESLHHAPLSQICTALINKFREPPAEVLRRMGKAEYTLQSYRDGESLHTFVHRMLRDAKSCHQDVWMQLLTVHGALEAPIQAVIPPPTASMTIDQFLTSIRDRETTIASLSKAEYSDLSAVNQRGREIGRYATPGEGNFTPRAQWQGSTNTYTQPGTQSFNNRQGMTGQDASVQFDNRAQNRQFPARGQTANIRPYPQFNNRSGEQQRPGPERTTPFGAATRQHAMWSNPVQAVDATGNYQGNRLQWDPDQHAEVAQHVEVDYPEDGGAYGYPEVGRQHDHEDGWIVLPAGGNQLDQIQHVGVDHPTYTCRMCDHSFESRTTLVQHLRDDHGDDRQPATTEPTDTSYFLQANDHREQVDASAHRAPNSKLAAPPPQLAKLELAAEEQEDQRPQPNNLPDSQVDIPVEAKDAMLGRPGRTVSGTLRRKPPEPKETPAWGIHETVTDRGPRKASEASYRSFSHWVLPRVAGTMVSE